MITRPETHLYYPQSRLLKSSVDGQGPVGGLYRPRAAFAQAFLETPASPNEVIDWFRQQLLRRGWQVRSQQGSIVDLTRGNREVFDVQVFGHEAPNGVPYDGAGNVYQIYYQVSAER